MLLRRREKQRNLRILKRNGVDWENNLKSVKSVRREIRALSHHISLSMMCSIYCDENVFRIKIKPIGPGDKLETYLVEYRGTISTTIRELLHFISTLLSFSFQLSPSLSKCHRPTSMHLNPCRYFVLTKPPRPEKRQEDIRIACSTTQSLAQLLLSDRSCLLCHAVVVLFLQSVPATTCAFYFSVPLRRSSGQGALRERLRKSRENATPTKLARCCRNNETPVRFTTVVVQSVRPLKLKCWSSVEWEAQKNYNILR